MLSAGTTAAAQSRMTDEQWAKCMQVLLPILQQSRIPELRDKFLPQVLEKQVGIEFGAGRVLSSTEQDGQALELISTANFGLVHLKSGEWAELFNFDCRRLQSSNVPLEEKELEIYHECMHMLQCRSGLFPKYLWQPTTDQGLATLTEEQLKWVFLSELQAHVMTATKAAELGWLKYDHAAVYKKSGAAGVAQEVIAMYSANPTFDKVRKSLPIWAEEVLSQQ